MDQSDVARFFYYFLWSITKFCTNTGLLSSKIILFINFLCKKLWSVEINKRIMFFQGLLSFLSCLLECSLYSICSAALFNMHEQIFDPTAQNKFWICFVYNSIGKLVTTTRLWKILCPEHFFQKQHVVLVLSYEGKTSSRAPNLLNLSLRSPLGRKTRDQ